MFYTIPLSHDFDYYCDKIDTHIKEDFETKIPDYGAEAFNPIGFHFKRNGNSISGIYRSKHAKVGGNAFVSQSTHMHFFGKMKEDKAGNRCLSFMLVPQITQLFMLVISLAFIIALSPNISDTYIYVGLFAAILIYSVIETVSLSSLVKKEFLKFFK